MGQGAVRANMSAGDMVHGERWPNALGARALVGERYRIVAPLARGGFGMVYVAEQLITGRQVALKVLCQHSGGARVEQLLDEARILSGMRSEHIVQVIDAGIDATSSGIFLVMELLSGATLADVVEESGPQTPSDAAEYLRQIAAGLDKAHGHLDREGRLAPIVHRDLKPANLFRTHYEDGRPLIKILDFGTAKVLGHDASTSGLIRGTPQYMAYEQIGGGPISIVTDIWALGLLAFFFLTGRSYWLALARASSQPELFAEILTLPIVAPSERARELRAPVELGSDFDAWFLRCVNRDVSARFSSAGAAANALIQALGVGGARALVGESDGAGPDGRKETRGGPIRRTPVPSRIGDGVIGDGVIGDGVIGDGVIGDGVRSDGLRGDMLRHKVGAAAPASHTPAAIAVSTPAAHGHARRRRAWVGAALMSLALVAGSGLFIRTRLLGRSVITSPLPTSESVSRSPASAGEERRGLRPSPQATPLEHTAGSVSPLTADMASAPGHDREHGLEEHGLEEHGLELEDGRKHDREAAPRRGAARGVHRRTHHTPPVKKKQSRFTTPTPARGELVSPQPDVYEER